MSNPFNFSPVLQNSGWCSPWPGFFQGCVSIFESSFICCWKRGKPAWWKTVLSLLFAPETMYRPAAQEEPCGSWAEVLRKYIKKGWGAVLMYTFESTRKAASQLFLGCTCGIFGQNVWPVSQSPCLKWSSFKYEVSGMHWLSPSWD